MKTDETSRNALEGIKVLEFGNALVGPITTKQLGDYGATVVRIESPLRPDPIRTSQPFKDNRPGLERSGYFAYFNANKYSIALDLNRPKGLELAAKLTGWADIVVENFRPGVMEKWGFSYEDLKKRKPDIIMLRTSNQGQTGPYRRLPGVGNGLNGLIGLVHFTGWPGRPPTNLALAYTDYITCFFATTSLIAALDYRNRTGKGQMLDISQFEVGLQFFLPGILDYTINKTENMRMGNACDLAAPHGAYPCKGEDRWCALAVFTDEQWESLCRLTGNPILKEDKEFGSFEGRKKNEEHLNSLLEAWTRQFTPEELTMILQDEGIPAGIVKSPGEIFEDPQLRHRNFFWRMEHSEMGLFHSLGQSAILSETPARGRTPAPLLGEHTEFVCREFLGMSEKEFDEHLIDGTFGL